MILRRNLTVCPSPPPFQALLAVVLQVFDLVGHVALAEALTLRLGLLNLTDAKYFEWWNVRGRPAHDPVIDRFSSPGLSGVASLAYDW